MDRIFSFCLLICSIQFAYGDDKSFSIQVFGEAGKFNMLYDCRQRPQAVQLQGKIHIVYNGDAKADPKGKGKDYAYPMLITYDIKSATFSKSIRLGSKDRDHHFSPIIWVDKAEYIHVLSGCQKRKHNCMIFS
jgi:hypothetical protein